MIDQKAAYHSKLQARGLMCSIYLLVFADLLGRWGLSLISYTDEVFALLGIAVLIVRFFRTRIIRFSRRRYPMYFAMGAFLLCGLAGGVIYGYQRLTAVVSDLFMCTKFWLAITTVSVVFPHIDLRREAKFFYRHICFIIAVLFLFLCVDYAFGTFQKVVRYGIRGTRLFFTQPTVMACICSFLLVMLLSLADKGVEPPIKHRTLILLMLFLSGLIVLSLRSKAIAGIILFWLMYFYVIKGKRRINLLTILMGVCICGLIAADQIEYYFFSAIQQDSARYQMLSKSFTIAADHFPLGAGFASYGSYMSQVSYSPLYSLYGLSGIHGLTRKSGSFISDNFWPMIIGQTGFLGAIAYLFMIGILFKKVQLLAKDSSHYSVAGLFSLAYLLISSTAEAAFVHPMAMPFAIWLGVLIAQMNQEQQPYTGEGLEI